MNEKPPAIPWLRPRNWQEQALAEMICGAAIEFQRHQPECRRKNDLPALHTEDYWSGYWSALVDYGRRIFPVKDYYGPGGERAFTKKRGERDDKTSTTAEEDGARAVSEEEVPGV